MSRPVRLSLPVVPNWDCQGCTDCCREYSVHVTDEERRLIGEQGWEKEPAFAGLPLFVREGSRWRRGRWKLNHTDGACIFLGPDGRCRIHAKFGSAAKPLACRVYPFVLVPTGSEWRVGLRYACPSAADGKGRPITTHAGDLRQYASALETQENISGDIPAPPLQSGQLAPWADVSRFTDALRQLVADRADPLERRLRKCVALADLCRQAKFDKISGHRLGEFLEVIAAGLGAEVPGDPADVPPPTWVGRILFRQAVALLARKDQGHHRGVSRFGRPALLVAAWRFARGRGRVPAVHGLIPKITFAQIESDRAPLPPEAEEVLERYYQLKLDSMQFCGATNFHLPFWDGLASLLLTFPAVTWLARAFADRPREEAVRLALRTVDDNFGFNPLLGSGRQKFALRLLAQRGELRRLIAWYGRPAG